MPELYRYVLGRRTWFVECQPTLTQTLAVTILFGARSVPVSAIQRPPCGVRSLAVTTGRIYE